MPHKPPPAASSMILRREESTAILGPESPRNPIAVPSSEQRTQISARTAQYSPDKREERGKVLLGQEVHTSRGQTAARCRRAYRCRWKHDRRMVMFGIAPFATRGLQRSSSAREPGSPSGPPSGLDQDASWRKEKPQPRTCVPTPRLASASRTSNNSPDRGRSAG